VPLKFRGLLCSRLETALRVNHWQWHGQVRSGIFNTRPNSRTMRVTRQLPRATSRVSTGLNLATLEKIGVAQHSLPNYELCHETSDSESESVPKNGQVQLRAHARAAFAS
jgi:hypothetical protein